MKKFGIAVLAAGILSGGSLANAASVDFIKLTQTVKGESAWAPLSLAIGNVNMTITAGGTADDDAQQYAYLDWGNAGLGNCKDLSAGASTGANPGSKGNICSNRRDDNVNEGEYLSLVFDHDVVIENLWFNNNHDGKFKRGDLVSLDGTDYGLVKGYAGGPHGVGSFNVAAGDAFVIAFENRQFYLGGIEVSEVPVPGTLGLLGIGMLGLAAVRRRVNG